MKFIFTLCFLLLISFQVSSAVLPIVIWHGLGNPVIQWYVDSLTKNTIIFPHESVGDVCCNPLSVGGLLKFIQQEIPDVYVISLKIGNTTREVIIKIDVFPRANYKNFIWKDFENAYIKNANDQVKFVCDLIKNDSKLALGYQGLGISQGGQFL